MKEALIVTEEKKIKFIDLLKLPERGIKLPTNGMLLPIVNLQLWVK
jgi:hypothetical protein